MGKSRQHWTSGWCEWTSRITFHLPPASVAWPPIPVDACVFDACNNCRSTRMSASRMGRRTSVSPCAAPCDWAACFSTWTTCRTRRSRTACRRCDGRECDCACIADSMPNNCTMCIRIVWRNVAACACADTICFSAICRTFRTAPSALSADAWSNGTTDCCGMQIAWHKCDIWSPDRAACGRHSHEWWADRQRQI